MLKIKPVILLLLLLLFGCAKEKDVIQYPLNEEEAADVVGQYLHGILQGSDGYMEPGGNIDFTLSDITTNELYLRTGGQVFHIESGIPGLSDTWIFIIDKELYNLHTPGQYANGIDLQNLKVTDLNQDGISELIYTAHAGSGVLKQGVNCFSFDVKRNPHLRSAGAFKFPLDYQITLVMEDSHLFLYYADRKYYLKIGEVLLHNPEVEEFVEVMIFPDLPESVQSKLDGNLKNY